MTRSNDDFQPPLDWDAPPARQLPYLRERLIQQLASPAEYAKLRVCLQRGNGNILPDSSNLDWSAQIMLADESNRLVNSQMYSITDQMTALAVHAGEQIPEDWSLRYDDLPGYDPEHPTRVQPGFAVYDVPFAGYRDGGLTVSIVAASWGPTALAKDDDDAMWLTFWSAADFNLLAANIRTAQHQAFGERINAATAMIKAREQSAELAWDNEAFLCFNTPTMLYGKTQEVKPGQASYVTPRMLPWVQSVRATWLLMKRGRTTVTEEVHQPKQQRKAALRKGYSTEPVRVVRLHRDVRPRPPRDEQSTGTGRKPTVCFPVGGYWRDQPYPSRGEGVTERIWIEEHDRGLANSEYRVGRKYLVRVLDRPPTS